MGTNDLSELGNTSRLGALGQEKIVEEKRADTVSTSADHVGSELGDPTSLPFAINPLRRDHRGHRRGLF
ncbi:hypothetical protein GYA54_03330 [Candidatus Kuenenbacteria bacterium]|nr:hypothetical protein [Candidatus Kuenenbacteria bacterium]